MSEKNSPPVIYRNRHSVRMKGFDYSAVGAYFITIATYQRICIFGEVANGRMLLNQYGNIASQQWVRLSKRFKECDFSCFVIMPNHMHGIITIGRGAGEDFNYQTNTNPPLRPYVFANIISGSLAAIVRAYKSSVTYRINAMRGYTLPPVWQRNYYDHIIRNETDLQNTSSYIHTNPINWFIDELHSTTQN